MELADEAEYLSSGEPCAKLSAFEIMDKLDEIYKKTPSKDLKKQITGLRNKYFKEKLSKFFDQ